MADERWWKAPGMVALTSTKTNMYLVFTGPKIKSGSLALNELLVGLVGEETPRT
jgi:hypothetical protein